MPIIAICETCGGSFPTYPCRVARGEGRHCSRECRNHLSIAERFELKVNHNGPTPKHCPGLGPCWVWTASCNLAGYGLIGPYLAHRLAWFLKHDRWPEPCCLHKCDNPACVNPAHLFEGTKQENMADMVAKGRSADKRGTRNGRAKITEADARKILERYAAGELQKSIAEDFGIAQVTVSCIVTGRTWKSLLSP